jgi:glycosyltransferase involved in cell wall biosynthesis
VPDVCFAIPGDLTTLTGGYAYARRLIEALPTAGWTAHHVVLPGSFPKPSDADLSETRSILAALPQNTPVLVDGLAFGAMPASLLANLDHSYTALVHHPLAEESGISAADAQRFQASERAALGLAQSVVVTSQHTRETVAHHYGVKRDHVFLAEPGTDPAPRAHGAGSVPKLLTVATLTHRKAPDVLINALGRIKDIPWTSELVGSLDRDVSVTANVRRLIEQHGLEDRVALRGELHSAALDAAYDGSDVFVLPSRHEGYGMAFAEALTHGLPIVACAAGAVSDTVPEDAGHLVPPDDADALAQALRRVLTDASHRRALADRAWHHGQHLPTWNDTAAKVSEALWAALP